MSKYLVDIEEIKETLELLNSRVKKNTKIQTPDTLGQEFLYHIALDRRNRLFPNISKRGGAAEDNTVPRVHMALNIMNCWYGYAGGGELAANSKVDASNKKVSQSSSASAPYKGGFYIHRVPFRACLEPNKELVYDSDVTQEQWLITYNQMTVTFPAEIIGLLFTHSVAFYPITGKSPVEVATLCLRVDKGYEMHFGADNEYFKTSKQVPKILRAGFYMFEISNELGVKNFKTIREKEFNDYKLRSAGLLSF